MSRLILLLRGGFAILTKIPPRLLRNPLHLLSLGLGSGLSPFAPGTCGTLVAIPLYLLLAQLPLWYYLGAVVVLVSTMVHGVTEKRAASMQELCGVSRRTLERWRKWWRQSFVVTELWRVLRGRFVPSVNESLLPSSLVERMEGQEPSAQVLGALRLLLPLTAGASCIVAF